MSRTTNKKPNQLITAILWLFFKPFLRLKFNFKYNRTAIENLKGPAIILSNHASVLDVFLMGVSAFPISLNYVASYDWFNYFGLSFILRHLKAIPKFQYQIDLVAIKQMINVTKQNQILGLFPTGRLSSAGVGQAVDDNVAKLIKKLDVPVYFFKIDGAYLSVPKWAKYSRKGRIEGKYHLVYDQQTLRQTSTEKITAKCNEYLLYDDYLWNETKRIKFSGKRLAENLEQVLFICPACKTEGNLKTADNKIKCNCGFELQIEAEGSFTENQYFRNPRDWNNYQKQVLLKKHKEESLELLSEVKVTVAKPGQKRPENYGNGFVTLIANKLVFKDQDLSKSNALEINVYDFPSLPFKSGENFEISKNENIYKFYVKKGYHAAKWSLVTEVLSENLKYEK